MKRAGFTLLEVIVALALLSVSITVVLQIFSGGLKNIHKIDLAHRAMSYGENVMNEILADTEIVGPTSLSDDLDENFRYTAQVDEWSPPDDGLSIDVDNPEVYLLEILVEVHFKKDRFGKKYQLRCLKAVSTSDPLTGDGSDPVRQLFQN